MPRVHPFLSAQSPRPEGWRFKLNAPPDPARCVINALIIGPRPTGLGHNTLELLKAFLAESGGFACTILLDEGIREWLLERLPAPPEGIDLRFIPVGGNRRRRILFEQLRLPRLLGRWGTRVYAGLAFVRPFRLPRGCRSLVIVPDLFFRIVPKTYTPLTRLYYRMIVSASIRRAEEIGVISEHTGTDLVRLYPGKESFLIPSAAPERARREDPDLEERLGRHPYVFCLGRLEKRKNLPNMVRAFALALDRLPPGCRLVIGGREGYGHEAVHDLVRELGMSDRVDFPGYIDDGLLHIYYRNARAFLFVSIYEGFGIPILEAFEAGCPVITSSVSSMPEVAGDAALFVPPDEPEAIASALVRVVTDTGLARSLRQAGAVRLPLYSWKRSAEALRERIMSMLEEEK